MDIHTLISPLSGHPPYTEFVFIILHPANGPLPGCILILTSTLPYLKDSLVFSLDDNHKSGCAGFLVANILNTPLETVVLCLVKF
jgi:hypothetical protein